MSVLRECLSGSDGGGGGGCALHSSSSPPPASSRPTSHLTTPLSSPLLSLLSIGRIIQILILAGSHLLVFSRLHRNFPASMDKKIGLLFGNFLSFFLNILAPSVLSLLIIGKGDSEER